MNRYPSQENVLEIYWGEQRVISTNHATYPRQIYTRLNQMIGGPDRDIPVGFIVSAGEEASFARTPITGQYSIKNERGTLIVKRLPVDDTL